MTLEEFERRLKENSPNYQGSIAQQLEQSGQTLSQYFSNRNKDNNEKESISNNSNSKEVLKAPISQTINKKVGIDIDNLTPSTSFKDNLISGFYGFNHLSKPIGKTMLNTLNEALPYYYNINEDFQKSKESLKNKDLKESVNNTFKLAKDTLLIPVDYVTDKAKEFGKRKLKENGADNSLIDVLDKFNIINEDKYNFVKSDKEEIQKMIDEEYEKVTPNKALTGVAKIGSDIGISMALNALGVPSSVTYGAISGAETYGNTDDVKQIAGDTVIGAGTGAISDVTTPVIKEASKVIIPKVGQKLLPTLASNYGSNFIGAYMGSYGANTIGQQIKNMSLNLTPEQQKEINDNALSFAIFSSIIGGTKDTVSDIKTAKSSLNKDVNETIQKLQDANAQLERTDYTSNNAIRARLKARGNEIISELESKNYFLNNKNKELAVRLLRTAYDGGNIQNINYANNQVIALLGSAEMNSKISQGLTEITNQETANKIVLANEKLMNSNLSEESKWKILDEATSLYEQNKNADEVVNLIEKQIDKSSVIASAFNNIEDSITNYSKDRIDNALEESNKQSYIQDRLNELKKIDITNLGLIEKVKTKREIRALEAGYTNVDDYQRAEKLKAKQAKIEYEKRTKNKSSNLENESNIDYKMQHRPTKNGVGYDITSTDSIGKDIYTNPEKYVNMSLKYNQESYKALIDIKDNPDAELTIYRASPKKELNEGDWITLSKNYAEMEAKKENVPVNEFKVKAKDIQFAGDDINEFGYFPQKESSKSILVFNGNDVNITNKDIKEKVAPTPKDFLSKNSVPISEKAQIKNDTDNFAKQVDEYVSGNLKSGSMIRVGKTPKVLKDIGVPNRDIVLKQSKLKTILKEDNNPNSNEHGIPIDTIKEIPRALSEPLNILKSSTQENSIVVVTDLADKLDRPIIVSIELDYEGQIGNIKVLNNRLTSIYGKREYDRFMNDEIEKGNLLYDIDEGIIKELPTTGLQLSKGISSRASNKAPINNIIPLKQNYVKSNENSKFNVPIEQKLKKSMIENSPKEAQKVLNNDKIEVKQAKTNTKVISNDNSIQVSNSGNIYPQGNKPTSEDFNKKGLENHFKKGDTRLVPVDKKHAEKGYTIEKWTGNQWKNEDKYNDFNGLLEDNGIDVNSSESPKDVPPFDEKGKTKTLDFISDNRKKEKVKVSEVKDFVMQKFVNKGHYVDKLAENTNNPELKYAFDKTLSTYGEANYSIGIAQTDNNGKEIGKSILDIFKPSKKAGLYKEFNDYLINRHNLDRQALGKAIYNESVTSEDSRRIIQKYENLHPEFKEWANDVYTFNKNELHNLVEEGFISKELEEHLHDIYGDYIPIHRDIIDIVNQAEESRKTGAVNPIKKAKGGNQNILNIEDAMAENVLKNKKAIRKNQLGKQLAKSTGNEKIFGDYGIDTSIFSPDAVMNISDNVGVQKSDGKYLYTIFVNGEIKQFKINEELFESLRADTLDIKIKNNKYANKILSPIEKATKVQRDVLTTYSIGFALNNPIKDFQDGLFNSKFGPAKFVINYGKALQEIATNGKIYKEYMALGGNSNSYFEYGKGIKKETSNPISKILKKVQDINEILETGPRLSEYISTIESGGSKNEAMYNASDITTNFKRGGEYTKILNKYGANFLNASVQGLDKVIRNFTGKKTSKDWLRLLCNVAVLGVAPTMINYLIYRNDEDYQNLESYIKDEYYLIKKGDDGEFFRIPKGRILATISATARRIIEGSTGGDFDVAGLNQEIKNQLAPNNPAKDNILSPIIQVGTNNAWYGGKIVPSRLENQLPKNQYDEKTDKISLWLGENLNISPIKINYLIDQYSGGFGDVVLPMLTPRAENNIISDKFTTDSVLKNKNVGSFYDNLEKYEKLSNDVNPTKENTIKYSYLNKISSKIGKLYSQKREIQLDSGLNDSQKKQLVREVQKEINGYCQTANKLVDSKYLNETKWQMYIDGILSDEIRKSDGSSTLQDALYIVNNNLATKKEYMDIYENYKANDSSIPTSKTLTKLKENNVTLKNYAEYDLATKKYESDKDKEGNAIPSSLTVKKATYIYKMNISDKEKNDMLKVLSENDYSPKVEDMRKLNGNYLTYFQQSGKKNEDSGYSARQKYMIYINAGIPVKELNKFYSEISDIEGVKDSKGNTISGSKKQAVFNYVNSLSLSVSQKQILLAREYKNFANQYYADIVEYINKLELSMQEKHDIYEIVFSKLK